MSINIKRAIVLAAGFGTRLRPLTDCLPKPLMPLANRPLLAWILDALQRSGVEKLAINLHHLGKMIPSAIERKKTWNIQITWSTEDTILGTGGALVNMRAFVREGAFFLVNGDIFSIVDLRRVLEFHQANKFAATMVVRPLPKNSDFTALQRDSSGKLVEFKGIKASSTLAVEPCMFCGVHVLEPTILDYLPTSGFSCVNDRGYAGMMADGLKIGTFMYRGPWFDMGTPSRYLDASCALLSGKISLPDFQAPENGVLIAPDAVVSPRAKIGPNVAIGSNCHVPDGAIVRSSIILPGTRIGSETIDSCILTPHTKMQVLK